MSDMEILLLGFALGAIPSAELSRIMVAFIAKRLGVKAKDVEELQDAASD